LSISFCKNDITALSPAYISCHKLVIITRFLSNRQAD